MNKIFAIFSAMAVVATPFYGAMQKKADAKKAVACASLESGMGLPMDNSCYPAGYNAPANIKLADRMDITGQVSFIYWFVGQDNMSVGTKESTDGTGVTTYRSLQPSSEFAPGFKIGGAVDLNYDDWRMFADYTWLHESTHHGAPIGSGASVTPLRGSDFDTVTKVQSNWKMHLDMLDVGFNRAFYRSKRITLSPVAGLKALWIRQNLNIDYETATTDNTYNTKSHSWAIGPMLGTNAHWLFCHGLRLEGKASAAIVYTRFTQLTRDIHYTSERISNPSFNSVNPMAELGMGFGWGRYLDNQKYYIDLSARYDFNIFWNQNQLQSGGGDLYMHGLTLTGRFDF